MRKEIIFRDDDIAYSYFIPSEQRKLSPEYILARFKEIDALFIKYGVKHTIAVTVKNLDKAIELIDYIKQHPHIEVQLHGYDHDNHTKLDHEILENDFNYCMNEIKNIFHKTPSIFYPPWNLSNELVKTIAEKKGLIVSNKKISLSQYLRGYEGDVINFHYWSDECKDLEAALKKYTGK